MAAFANPVEENESFPRTDLTLVIEGQKLYVNKEVLAEHSPVFNTMFTSDFKERTATEIELKGKNVEAFTEFLKCFYPNMVHEITERNVLQILPIAHEYHSPLKEKCENFMSRQCNTEKDKRTKKMSIHTLLDYVKAAETYDLPKLLKSGIELCAYVSSQNLKGKITKYDYESKEKQAWPYKGRDLEVDSIASRYYMLTSQTRLLIAEKRVAKLESVIKFQLPDEYSSHSLCDEPWNSFIRL